MTYEELRKRLLPEATDLFTEMARAHIASSGDRFFILVVSGSGADLLFTGSERTNFGTIDPGTLDDLAGYGLLRKGYGTRDVNYRVTSEGIHFYRWLMSETGNSIEQVEFHVLSLVSGRDFASAHPSASHHLSEAFGLLWSNDITEKSLSELGDHLRNAIFDVSADLASDAEVLQREKPIAHLRDWLATTKSLGERERRTVESLVELVATVLSLDQRVTHVRDEKDKGRPLEAWDEVRARSVHDSLRLL